MTTPLTQAFDRASTLPAELQNELAAVMNEEIDSELFWKEQFESSGDTLAELGRKALEEYRTGRTHKRGFDEL